MRTWLYNAIKSLSLPGMMEQRIFASGAADNPVAPFIVITMGSEQPPLGMSAESATMEVPFDVWIYDKPGSMLDIDTAAKAIKDHLPAQAPAVVGSVSVYEVRWLETSNDLYDDHYGMSARRVGFRITARR